MPRYGLTVEVDGYNTTFSRCPQFEPTTQFFHHVSNWKNSQNLVRLKVLMAVAVKIHVFWDMMLCSLVDKYECFI
jgi:hypothetical protein